MCCSPSRPASEWGTRRKTAEAPHPARRDLPSGGDILFFFFQAEDGIRDLTVTGVQTCALPIYMVRRVGPAAAHERALPRLEAVQADRDGGERPREHLSLSRDLVRNLGKKRSDGDRKSVV